MYRVYELKNLKTGEVYIGMTGRELEVRKAEHMLSASTNTQREIVNAIRNYPNSEDWSISDLHVTPLYPEAKLAEKAFIKEISWMYVTLNTDFPKIGHEPSLDFAKYVIDNGKYPAIDKFPWEWVQHSDYPDIYVYKLREEQYWRYGYKGRGNTDTDHLWKEYYSQHKDVNDAHFEAAKHFECFNANDILDMKFQSSDKQSPLQSLVTIQNILSETDFTSQNDVENFFKIVEGMKTTV